MADAQFRQVVKAPIKSLFDTILDFENYPRYVGGVKKASIVSKSPDGLVVAMTTELMKRIEYTINAQSEYGENKAKIWWKLSEGDFFQKNNGLWELTKVDEQNTQVLYKLDLEFSVSVPSFILKGLIKTSLPKAVEDMTHEAQRRNKT